MSGKLSQNSLNTRALLWQLTESVEAVVFDCDSTLTQIEGLDALAAEQGQKEEVAALTEIAMSKTGITRELFQKRLELVRPTVAQVASLADVYYRYLTPDADRLIHALHEMGKTVYVVSAGLKLAVMNFVGTLGVPPECVFAVDVYFSADGQYRDYERKSPMTHHDGKWVVIEHIKKKHERLAYVGDGLNDVVVVDVVERFIGYGGAVCRSKVVERSPFYIMSSSLAPVLPLCLTESEQKSISSAELLAFYELGMSYFDKGEVLIQTP